MSTDESSPGWSRHMENPAPSVTPAGVNRRQFLQGAAGLSFKLALGNTPHALGRAASGRADSQALSAWVNIAADGAITIFNPVAEMGQGSATALPLIIAEEMDADWAAVSIEYSPINAETYGHNAIYGRWMMLTVSSISVEAYFDRLRLAGAQVRYVLMLNAAQRWGVDMASVSTGPSVVVHEATGRRLSYGEVVAFAVMPDTLPASESLLLKSPGEFRLIGRSVPRRDIPGKVDGSAEFAIDVDLPGMQYGMIQRAPVVGASPKGFNREVIAALPGITFVGALDNGVGIVGNSLWAVMKARRQLQVIWTAGALAGSFDSDLAFAHYADAAKDQRATSLPIVEQGDVLGAVSRATTTLSADYLNNFVYHAQMEPLNAVASVSEAGDGLELWVGSQFTSGLRDEAAKLLAIDPAMVTIHPRLLGGGFGRRSWHDFGLEAVQLALLTKTPVKLVWSREDDLQNGAFRPVSLQRMEAGLDAAGKLISWQHLVVGDGPQIIATGARIPYYDVPNQAINLLEVPSGLRTKHWRAVGYGPNKFAIESFIDELAVAQGTDPYRYRVDLLHAHPRALVVLNEAVAMSPYGSQPLPGRALGLAFCEHFKSLTAGVVEISLAADSGKIQVHRVWLAVDAGRIVQPDNALSQLEGAIIQGIGSALMESVSVKDGVVQEANFHNYAIMKMADVPEINVRMVESDMPPLGVGEIGLPFTGPAIANAFAALTGKRLRHMPFTSANVALALSADSPKTI